MARLEDERAVVELACLTADRTRSEQASLMRVARRVSRQWNARTVTNKPERYTNPIDLEALVEDSRAGGGVEGGTA